jgi:hypothetical protein
MIAKRSRGVAVNGKVGNVETIRGTTQLAVHLFPGECCPRPFEVRHIRQHRPR